MESLWDGNHYLSCPAYEIEMWRKGWDLNCFTHLRIPSA